MKNFSLIVCSLMVIAISNCHAASLHRSKRQIVPKEFANINIENYLKNDRAVQFQLKCIVYDGPCDRIGKYLKVTIPELLTNQCQNCDPTQRQRAGRLVQHIQQKFPKEWSDAVQKFQGGQVKKEDADRLESLLGVKLDSKLVADSPATEAPVTTAAPVAVEVSSTTAVPSSSSVAPETTPVPSSTTSVPEPSSSSAPEVTTSTSTTTTTAAPPSTAATNPPVTSSTVAPEVSSSVVPEIQSSASPVTSEAPSTSSSSTTAPVQSSPVSA